jgi:transcriptional regulator with XRE-family HTH domain
MPERRREKLNDTEPIRIGLSIKEIRSRNRLSQVELAMKACISVPYLEALEEGRLDEISPDVLDNILDAGKIDARTKGSVRTFEEVKKIFLSIHGSNPPMDRLL